MSSSNTWALVGGVVGGVIGFFIGGPVGALYGFSLGSMAAGLIAGPEGADNSAIKPDELSIPTSSEAATVPVIFGTSRMPGNHIGYDRDSFKVVTETQDAGGKGGGGEEQVTGYLYFLTWQMGLCMGEVDELVRVVGVPGQDNVLYKEEERRYSGNALVSPSTNKITALTIGGFNNWEVGMSVLIEEGSDQQEGRRGFITAIDFTKTIIDLTPGTMGGSTTSGPVVLVATYTEAGQPFVSGDLTVTLKGKADDGGTVTIKPGTLTQTGEAIAGKTYNYRGVCFAHFANFKMGRSTAPRGYLFELRRFPRCRNAAGDIITGIKTRASSDSTEGEYNDSNPAAVVWEIFTDTVWGKGMSPDKLHEDDFIAASEYYEANRIGISTAMAGETGMSALMDKLRAIFGLAVWFDGDQVRCRVVWDRENAYSPRTRIDDEDIVGTPVFSRQSIVSTVNELRLDFTNRANSYQSETVTVQDLGAIEELDAVRSEKIEAKEIGTRRTAELLAHRLIRELAYQPARLQLNVHRAFADRAIGEFIEVYWQAWRDGGGFTSFWRLEGIRDNETEDNLVTLTLIEDIYATGQDGEISDFEAPIISIDVDQPLGDDDFGGINYTTSQPLGDLTPILVDEPNAFLTRGQRRLAVAVQRQLQSIQTITLGYAEASVLDYQTLGILRPFAITGVLLDDISATGPKLIRQSADAFRIALTNESADAANLLSAASLVEDGTDHFSDLTARAQNLMVINGEYFRIGYVEETGSNEYTIHTAMRGELATSQAAHATNDSVWFITTFEPNDYLAPAGPIPIDTAIKLRLQAFAPTGEGDAVTIDGPDSNGVDGSSTRPLPPSLKSASRAGLDWTIEIRPRIHWGGAGFGPSLESELLEELATIDPMRITIERGLNGGDGRVAVNEFFASGSLADGLITVTRCEWIPAERGDPDSAKIVIEVTMGIGNPTQLQIKQRYEGRESDDLVVDQPA